MCSTRPAPLPLKNPSGRPPVRLLSAITLGVLLGHWAVLSGAPLSLVLPGIPDTPSALGFTTRTLPRPAAVPTAAVPVRPRKHRPTPPAPQAAPAVEVPAEGLATTAVAADSNPSPGDSAPPQDDTTSALAAANTAHASKQPDSAETGAAPQTTAAAAEPPAAEPPPPTYRFPAPVRLKFEVRGKERGFPFFANGDLLWQHDGAHYDARYEISIFLLGKVSQTSTGQLTPRGLEPRRFGDKRRSEVAAHFERTKGKVTFSANTPDVPLQPGAQDNLSGWIHMASLFAGASGQLPAGTQVPFLSVGPRSAETWTLTVGELEKLTLPGGEVSAIHVVRTSSNANDGRADVWFAPSMDYMPVRILVTWAEDHLADQQWVGTEKP